MEISDRTRARVERGLGWPDATWRPGPGGGLTGAGRWLVEGPGETVFVKIAADEHSRQAIRREIEVFREVAGPFMPELLGWDRADPPFLVLEDLSAAHGPPPHPDDVEALFETLDRIAATSPTPKIRSLTQTEPRWPRLAHEALAPDWAKARLKVLAAAEQRATVTGERLVHVDVWAPNLCFTGRGAVLVDWADAGLGNPAIDVAYAILDLRRHGRRPSRGRLADEQAWAARVLGAMVEGLTGDLPWAADLEQARDTFREYLPAALLWAMEVFD